jgi:uncharacterized membrane protein YkvA (DUF1232 family)
MRLFDKIKLQATHLKAEAQVLIVAYKDKRTPLSSKMLIALTVGYLLSPIDLIPDFIPLLGMLDDLVIVPALMSLSIKLIPSSVLIDARAYVKTNPYRYKKSNWLFAVIIICIWVVALFYSYRYVCRLFGYDQRT